MSGTSNTSRNITKRDARGNKMAGRDEEEAGGGGGGVVGGAEFVSGFSEIKTFLKLLSSQQIIRLNE